MGYLGLTKVLMYALLFSAGINSVSSLAAFQSGYMYNRKAANFNPPIESKMTCDDFFNVLSTSPVPVKTIDKALEIVAQKRPKYLDYYTLAYQSRSLHDASFSDPRAIVYGYDGKFVLTFNGNPQQAGYENIEIMCFNDTLKQFEFREVTFPNEARDKKQLDDLTIEQKALAYVVSPLNGSPHRRCTACHKENARPIWESYPFWPGIYGSQDDYVANHKFRKMFTSEPLEERFFRDVKGVEVSQYLAFEKEKPNKPRYKWLGSPSPMEVGQPNFYINLVFQVLNGQRISRQLQEKKDRLIPLRYQLVQSLYC